LEAIADPAMIADANMTIINVNNIALQALGYTRAQAIGASAEILMPANIARRHAAWVTTFLRTGEKKLIGKPRRHPVLRADGSEFMAWLCLGELPRASPSDPLRFLARMRADAIETSGDTPPISTASMSLALTDIIESTIKTAQAELIRLANDEMLKIDEALQHTRACVLAEATRHHQQAADESDASDASDASDRSANRNYEHIEIHDRIADGGGSGASVYQCTVDGWGCCMKEVVLSNTTTNNLKNILNEVTVLEKLPYHKNLVRYLFHRSTPTAIQIFMRYYPCTLTDELRRRVQHAEGLFSAAEATRLALDVAAGIAVLHTRKLLHRYLSRSLSLSLALSLSASLSLWLSEPNLLTV
jgi:PAS domain S-box-containing protein